MKSLALLVLVSFFSSCSKDKTSNNDVREDDYTPPSLKTCENEIEPDLFDELFEDGLGIFVKGEVKGEEVDLECSGDSEDLTTEFLSTQDQANSYEIRCGNPNDTQVHLWLRGPDPDEGPFAPRRPYGDYAPNLATTLKSPEGELKQDSFAIDENHVEHLAAFTYELNTSHATSDDGHPMHLISGCVEGEFAAAGSKPAGEFVAQFRLVIEGRTPR